MQQLIQKIQWYLGLTITIFSFILLLQVLFVFTGFFNSIPSNLFFYHSYVEQLDDFIEMYEITNSNISLSSSSSDEIQEVFEIMILNNFNTQISLTQQNMLNSLLNYVYFLIVMLMFGITIILNSLQQRCGCINTKVKK